MIWANWEEPNLEMKLDTDTGITLNGGDVSQWDDQTIVGTADMVQATEADQPLYVASDSTLNDTPALDFDGSNHFMETSATISDFSGSAGFTFIGAFVVDNVSGNKGLCSMWDEGTDTTFSIRVEAGKVIVYVAPNTADTGTIHGDTGAGLVTANTTESIAVVYDGSGAANADRLKIWDKSGTQLSLSFTGTIPATLSTGTSPIRVGDVENLASTFFDGSIGDMHLASQAYDFNTIDNILQSYSKKYGWIWTPLS